MNVSSTKNRTPVASLDGAEMKLFDLLERPAFQLAGVLLCPVGEIIWLVILEAFPR